MNFVDISFDGYNRKNSQKTITLLNYVRIYVNHVKNICHLELANPMRKCILLVIG